MTGQETSQHWSPTGATHRSCRLARTREIETAGDNGSAGRPDTTGQTPVLPQWSGFTLIELLSAITILAILLALAIPSYQGQVLKARRNEGQALLLDIAARQERFHGDNRTFTADMTDLGYATDPAISENGNYSADAVAGSTGSLTTSFVATATRAERQLADTVCGDFTVDSDGRTQVINYAGQDDDPPAATPTTCW